MRRLVAIAMACAAMGIGISSGAYAATFKWASQGDILTFDPHAQNEAFNNTANSYVYETLVNLNKGKVEPSLAESWTSVPEGFVFKLRQGVKFHEGETLTAEDVAFSINRALHPVSQFKTFTAGILGAEALPNGDVLIKTINHSPVLLNQLAYLRILNKVWAEKHGAATPQNFVAKEEHMQQNTRTALAHSNFNLVKLISKQFLLKILSGGIKPIKSATSRKVSTPLLNLRRPVWQHYCQERWILSLILLPKTFSV